MLGEELASRLQIDQPQQRHDAPVAALLPPVANLDHCRLLDELGHEPTTLDDLVQRTGQSAATLSSMLLMLELESRVESLPGNRYQRLTAARAAD